MTGTTDKTETITVSRNTDQIVDGVKSFIEDYNALIDKLNSLIEEDTDYREYAPLTDAQKKEMSEDEQLALLATDGMLVKRPLVVGDGFILTGFKEPEWKERFGK